MFQTEELDGIKVIRVWTYITANEGFAKRTLDYMSFMVSATLAAPFVRNVDLVVGTSPQFFTACAAYVTSRLKRRPYVFELRDLWPESIRAVGAMGESKWLDRMEKLELFLYRKAAKVVSVTHSFRRNLISRGIDAEKIHVVTNGVDLSRFTPKKKDAQLAEELGLEGKYVAGYIGTHGMAHSLETILEAAERVRNRADGDRYRFLFLGAGARKQELQELAQEMGLDNVLFLDPVPKSEVSRYWSLLDVSIIHLKKTELFTTVIPSKLFECMGMGLPVLHGVAGESADIVEKEGVGVVFEPQNADALTDALISLAEDREGYEKMSARCTEAAAKYDRSALASDMLAILEGATATKGSYEEEYQ